MHATTGGARTRTAPVAARFVLLRGGLGARPGADARRGPGAAVARDVVAALVGAMDEGDADASLALALPACMDRHAIDLVGLIDVMTSLRAALLSVSDLDAEREPVPLGVRDARTAALGFAVYLRDLLGRAARARAAAPAVVASAAAALLE